MVRQAYHGDYRLSISLKNLEKIIQCLDTIIEMIQGPCVENQNALSDGKFLEII